MRAALTLNWKLAAIGGDVRTSHIFRALPVQRAFIAFAPLFAAAVASPAVAQTSTPAQTDAIVLRPTPPLPTTRMSFRSSRLKRRAL